MLLIIRLDNGEKLGCVDTLSLRQFLHASAGMLMTWTAQLIYLFKTWVLSHLDLLALPELWEITASLAFITYWIVLLVIYISVGLLFNKIVNVLKEEIMLSALYDRNLLKAKSEEKLETEEIKVINFLKLELNLKLFFYSFQIGVIKKFMVSK